MEPDITDFPTRQLRAKPVRLDELCRDTKFTKREIRIMYRGFKQDCPDGIVQEETFKEIYAKFFPYGNSSSYAHYVFKAFDVNSNGEIGFKDLLVSLSTLLRGSVYDRLSWIFKLYDVNGDGCITKRELHDIIASVYDIVGRDTSPLEERRIRDHSEKIFARLDRQGTGVVTVDQFVEACLKDDVISSSLRVYSSGFEHVC
ncbi:Calsenilin [Amphibalanus amphitrite]|uniref:Calsenilin n=2 Tax=Amphibalanus amphitrite TaxID=1232801 RepID=A0A6A4WH72_AMPAM|nr:Calsenilin [Amphibalanus amphitrite]